MQKLALYTKEVVPDMAHEMEMLTYAEYAYSTTNVELKNSSEGEKVLVIPNTFKETIGLKKAALRKAASDNDMTSLEQHHLYDFVVSTYIPAGQKSVSSRWVY